VLLPRETPARRTRPRRIPGHHPQPAPPRRPHHLRARRDHRPWTRLPRPGSHALSRCSWMRSTPPRPACPVITGLSPTGSVSLATTDR